MQVQYGYFNVKVECVKLLGHDVWNVTVYKMVDDRYTSWVLVTQLFGRLCMDGNVNLVCDYIIY